MNNINILIDISFKNPYLLLLIIPCLLIALIPFFKIKKSRRYTRNRLTSLILHSLIIILCVTIISGIDITKSERVDSEIVILKDESVSTNNVREEMDDYTKRIVDNTNKKSKIGLVKFGYGGCDILNLDSPSKISNKIKSKKYAKSTELDKTATDIENGIKVAMGLFDKKEIKKRIILLSDGLETDGSIESVAESLSKEKIEFNVVFFEPKDYTSTKEFQINDVIIDESVLIGSEVTFEVVVNSHKPTTANIKVYDNDVEMDLGEGKDVLNLKGGEETFYFKHVFSASTSGSSDIHVIRVELSSDEDLVSENNVFYTYTVIDGERSVLIIANNGTDTSKIVNQMKNNSYNCFVVSPNDSDFPSNVNALSNYGIVVMMDIDVDTLPKGFDVEVEKYVNERGGSFFVSGGENTFGNGHFEGTKFEEILPVEVEPKANNPRAIVICLDISNSMFMYSADGKLLSSKPGDASGIEGTRIDLARKGIIKTIESGLNPYDYIGIVLFGRNKKDVNDTTMILDLTEATRKSEIKTIVKEEIYRRSSEGSTNYDEALSIAKNMLDTCPYEVNNKSVVFINDDDGANDDVRDFETIIHSMVKPEQEKNKIDFSAIVVANSKSNNIQRMENIVGSDNIHLVNTDEAFSDIIYDICKSLPSAKYNNINGDGTPSIEERTTITKDMTGFPVISEYNGVSKKSGATVYVEYHNTNEVLDSNGNEMKLDNHDPIYAQWNYGKGKVGALMIDLSAKACSSLFTDKNGIQFLDNIINNIYPKGDVMDSDILVQFDKDNYTFDLSATIGDESIEDYKLYANMIKPDNVNDFIGELVQNGNEFVSNSENPIETIQSGVYKIEIKKMDSNNQTVGDTTIYTSFSYSQEYNTFYDMQETLAKLGKICNLTNGRIYHSADDIVTNISEISEVIVNINIQAFIIILALILFLLDICVRKFNFLWPHEMVNKKRTNK